MQVETVNPQQPAPVERSPERESPNGASVRSKRSASTELREPAGQRARTTDQPTREAPNRTEPKSGRQADNPLVQSLIQHSRFELSFRVDDATKKVVISVIDPDTDELIRQVPPEEMLRLAERLDSVKGSIFSSTV